MYVFRKIMDTKWNFSFNFLFNFITCTHIHTHTPIYIRERINMGLETFHRRIVNPDNQRTAERVPLVSLERRAERERIYSYILRLEKKAKKKEFIYERQLWRNDLMARKSIRRVITSYVCRRSDSRSPLALARSLSSQLAPIVRWVHHRDV